MTTRSARNVFVLVLVAWTSACLAARSTGRLRFREAHPAQRSSDRWPRTSDQSLLAAHFNAERFEVAGLSTHLHRGTEIIVNGNNSVLQNKTSDDKHGVDDIVFVDTFVVVYWSIVLIIMAIIVVWTQHIGVAEHRGLKKTLTGHHYETPEDTLAESMWSLNLIAAVGQAKFPLGRNIPPLLVLFVSLIMGVMQLFTLFLIVDSMDPKATPITTVPSTAWQKPSEAWTVNCMKWIMVAFLGMSVVPEAGDAQKVFSCVVQADRRRMVIGKWLPKLTSVFHYLVTMGVVIGGVSVVLSCQDVPSILYNSLAITFVNNLDDTMYLFFEQVFAIEADFTVKHMDLDGDGVPDVWDKPLWVEVAERFLLLLPTLWAFFLIGRAWYTNKMPSVVLHLLFHFVDG